MDSLTVGLAQQASDLDPAVNRAAVDDLATTLAGQPDVDLAVLPEAFARDFGKPGSDVGAFAEPLDGPFVTSLTGAAAASGATLVAGMFEVSDDPARPYNTLVVVDGSGLTASYRKIHLYDSFGYRESDRLTAGAISPVVVDVAGWKVGLMTCYDLRFPELARMLVDEGAEVLLVPAAWVAGPRKVEHWRTLLRARAVENTVYVAAVGQPGPRYTGHSTVIAPDGDVLLELGPDESRVGSTTVDRQLLDETRQVNPSLTNRRL